MTSQVPLASERVFANHRSRVGAERSARMRACLVECALLVFAEHGVDAIIVDKVIKAAGVSRGTFYNYFRTDSDLFVAVATEVSDEILRVVNPVVMRERNPAARIALGIRYVFQIVKNYPLLAEFLDQGGQSALRYGKLVNEVVPRDLAEGMAAGQLSVPSLRLGLDLLLGPVLLGFHTILTESVADDYPESLAMGILMALGVPVPEARSYCSLPLVTLQMPVDSLFYRAESRKHP